MRNVERLDCRNAAESLDLTADLREEAGCQEHGIPGFGILGIRHIVICMIARNNHQRTKNNLVVARFADRLDDVLTRGLLRFALDGADKHVLVAEVVHYGLHLGIGDLRLVRSAVSHEYERCAGFRRLVDAFEVFALKRRFHDRFRDRFLVRVDFRCILADFAQKRLRDLHGFELVFISCDRLAELVIFCAVHQMRRLDHKLLDAVVDRTFERLIHVVDELAVARLHMIDDDLRGERSSDRPVGERRGKRRFDAADVLGAAVIERRAEAHDQQFLFADLIRISRIVLRSVAGVSAEVIGIGFLTLDQFLLRIGQRVPRRLCGRALRVGLVRALLHIDRVDQRRAFRRQFRIRLACGFGRGFLRLRGFRRGFRSGLCARARRKHAEKHDRRNQHRNRLFHVVSSCLSGFSPTLCECFT